MPSPSSLSICKLRSSPCYAVVMTTAPTPEATLYDVLLLTAGATSGEIKVAYRRLARTCHPDVVAADRKAASTDKFMRIHAAYSTLCDLEKRAYYDRRLMAPKPVAFGRQRWPPCGPPRPFSSSTLSTFSATSFSGFGHRPWETDRDNLAASLPCPTTLSPRDIQAAAAHAAAMDLPSATAPTCPDELGEGLFDWAIFFLFLFLFGIEALFWNLLVSFVLISFGFASSDLRGTMNMQVCLWGFWISVGVERCEEVEI